MTGIFIRVERDGRWVSVEIEDATNTELRRHFNKFDQKRLQAWRASIRALHRHSAKETARLATVSKILDQLWCGDSIDSGCLRDMEEEA